MTDSPEEEATLATEQVFDGPPTGAGLSRSSSFKASSSGSATPALQDDTFSGFTTLLDLVVVLDAHLDLLNRRMRARTSLWKEKAIEVRTRAEDVISKRTGPLVARSKSYVQLGEATRWLDPGRPTAGSAEDSKRIEREKITERVELEVAKFRAKVQKRVSTMSSKWNDAHVVSLREKLSFSFGVLNIMASCLLLGFEPAWIPTWYSLQAAWLLPVRLYTYKKRNYHYFLLDFCYYVNVLVLVFLYLMPHSKILFESTYCLAMGPLLLAIPTWRNSLVLHSLDKITSLYIHIFPPFLLTSLRHFDPTAHQRYSALAEMPALQPSRSLVLSSAIYLVWQVAYYVLIVVARKEKIKQGRVTSFTYLQADTKGAIGKIIAKVPPPRREVTFMFCQFIYTIITMLPAALFAYDSKFFSGCLLISCFGVSVWNGACFYAFKDKRFDRELTALRRELEDLHRSSGGTTSPSVNGASLDGETQVEEPEEVSLDSISADTPLASESTGARPAVLQEATKSKSQ
ncbi:hypothetical protein E5Q_00929 [Mixia osmundae IAM 14324]|uniref:Glycerophosphocholine acyltransferase 1 n=1 Tax=Mixia osmundae (strain CBS 9802 / IAM 14324 / JCM 22182 / KY 12970) TaxID=764103 RepID=G7DUM0_MIXOS|nr:hypothetical protein E5Q_00929 [Mixia osmundae IAM 14324]